MNINSLFTLYSLLFYLLFSSATTLSAQNPASVRVDEISDFVDQLICQHSQSIDISRAEIIQFLKEMTNGNTQNSSNCEPPIPQYLSNTPQKMSFDWSAVSCADQYSIGHLGLSDGQKKVHKTPNTGIQLKNLPVQYYLVAFVSEEEEIGFGDLVIIIADKKLSVGTNNDVNACICKVLPQTLNPNTSKCDFFGPQLGEISFNWANNCAYNRYRFIVEGNIDGQNFTYDYWFTYGQSAPILYNSVNCNPNVPINILGSNSDDYLGQAAITVTLSGSGVSFSITSGFKGAIEVTGLRCDCVLAPSNVTFSNLEQSNTDEFSLETSDFQVFPNPSKETFNVELNLEQTQAIKLQLFDTNGKMILSEVHPLEYGRHQLDLATQQLPQGLYHLQVITKNRTFSEKLIKL